VLRTPGRDRLASRRSAWGSPPAHLAGGGV